MRAWVRGCVGALVRGWVRVCVCALVCACVRARACASRLVDAAPALRQLHQRARELLGREDLHVDVGLGDALPLVGVDQLRGRVHLHDRAVVEPHLQQRRADGTNAVGVKARRERERAYVRERKGKGRGREIGLVNDVERKNRRVIRGLKTDVL
eukprot:76339-Pleurochrysis_carterae.AAC.2